MSNGDFVPDTWYGIMYTWKYWYQNGLMNGMSQDDAIQFAHDQTTYKTQHACSLFTDAIRNTGNTP